MSGRADMESSLLSAAGLLEAVPFRIGTTTAFRGLTHRDGWLLRGTEGWGEFSPFPEYPVDEARRWLRGALEVAGTPLPPCVRTSVEVNVTVPAVPPDAAEERVAASGCRTAKVKVAEHGQSLADDLDRLSAVRSALGSDGHIRVDANAAWDVPTAEVALPRLARAAGGLEYVEQPCATLEELAIVRRRTGVRIAVDETLRRPVGGTPPDVRAVRRSSDVLILKVQPLGGVRSALAMAERIELPAVVSSALETSVGLWAGLRLALALPLLGGACGLATADLLASDITAAPLRPAMGRLEVRDRPPEPDPALLLANRPAGSALASLESRLWASLSP